jgi:5-methylcytosine-specific restriction endonuclease McrA
VDRTLLLNTTFEPLAIVSWRKAVTLLFLDKVEVVREYDREVRSVSRRMKLPAVIRLLCFVRSNRLTARFSRKNVFLRDDFTCQYCGKRFEPRQLTCDHLIPRSKGGKAEWMNMVTSCVSCNLRKGNRLPEEVEMHPRKKPSRPTGFHVLMLDLGVKTLTDNWKEYIYLRD